MEQLINKDIKQAMIEKATERLSAIRSIKAAIQVEKAKEGKEKLTNEEIIKIIQRLVNQSTDSVTQFTNAGRLDLVCHEEFLIDVYKTYLPEQLSEEKIAEKIREFIATTGASSVRDMGKVMALAGKEFVGKANMKEVGALVKSLLTN